MSEFRNDRRKRRNRYYGGGRGGGKRWRSSRDLQPGMEGVILTCYNSQQHQCLSEAYSLLNEYGDAMYGPEQRDTDPEELKLGDDDDDEEEEEEEEEEEDDDEDDDDEDNADDTEGGSRREGRHRSQSSPQKRPRRFMAVRTGVSNVLFIRTLGVDPDRLVHRIFQDLYETGELKSQIILRMLPVSASCRAMPEDLMYFLSSFLQPWFLWPKHATYQVCVKLRDSSQRLRDEIVRNVAGLVNELNPRNRVNRANPEISVIIEVIQSVCCISVLRDFTRFRKYNLQELAKERAAHKQGHPAPREPPTQEEGPPTGGKELPTQEEGPHTGGKELPTQKEGPHTGGKELPTQKEGSPTGGKELPTQKEGSPTGGKELPTQKEGSPTGGKELPTQKEGPHTGGKELPTQEEGPPTGGKELPTQKEGPPTQEKEPPTWEKESPTEEKEPPNQEEETNNQECDQQEATKSKTDTEEQHKEGRANTQGAVSQDIGVQEAEPE